VFTVWSITVTQKLLVWKSRLQEYTTAHGRWIDWLACTDDIMLAVSLSTLVGWSPDRDGDIVRIINRSQIPECYESNAFLTSYLFRCQVDGVNIGSRLQWSTPHW